MRDVFPGLLQNTDLAGEGDREGLDGSIAPSLLNGGIKYQTLWCRKKEGIVARARDTWNVVLPR
jgi:hypothetical protein